MDAPAACILDPDAGEWHRVLLTSPGRVLTLAPTWRPDSYLQVLFVQGPGGPYLPTWPSGIVWLTGAPTAAANMLCDIVATGVGTAVGRIWGA